MLHYQQKSCTENVTLENIQWLKTVFSLLHFFCPCGTCLVFTRRSVPTSAQRAQFSKSLSDQRIFLLMASESFKCCLKNTVFHTLAD